MEELTCFICRKHQGVIAVPGGCIYEDEYVYVGHIGSSDITVYKGYLIVDLKRHAAGLGDLTEEESQAVGSILNRVGRVLKKMLGTEHIYSFVQGDAFPHFHVHVIPRYTGTPVEFWNPMSLKNWRGAHGGVADILEICAGLRAVMNKSS
jgi:histidine triad (HIT) family protein